MEQESKALTTVVHAQVVNVDEYAMSEDRVVAQAQLIKRIMQSVMKEGEHFATLPGTNKPTLLKPGAEKICVTFRLVPRYEVTKTDLSGGHREYEITCSLYHAPTQQFFGQGLGSCTTLEGKYRYRIGEVEFTGQPVPKTYWNERNVELLGGKGFVARKNPETGQYEIARQGQKVEHDNPADYYNTVLKMAKKRALVDAILTATGASDLLTQDVEDMAENGTTFTAPKTEAKKQYQRAQNTRKADPTPADDQGSDTKHHESTFTDEQKENAKKAFMMDMVAINTKAAVIEWFNRNAEDIKSAGVTKEISKEVQERIKELQ